MGSLDQSFSMPQLDMSQWFDGNNVQRQRFADELCDCLKSHGFAKVVNHGLTDDAVKSLYEWNRVFFNLALESKASFAHAPGPDPQRGWSAVGSEQSAKLHRSKLPNYKSMTEKDLTDAREHFDQGGPLDMEYPNRWPKEEDLPGFRSFMENHYDQSRETATGLLEALELALKVPTGSFSAQCRGEASELRLNHYPPIRVGDMQSGKISRIWPHTDLGVLTCLFQDGLGGLEIEDRENKGSFHPLTRTSWNEMIVNVSETLERWTNGQLPAGVHQVTVPPSLKGQDDALIPARFSNAFFVKADRSANVGALPPFVREGEVSRYKPMTAVEYHTQRLATAY